MMAARRVTLEWPGADVTPAPPSGIEGVIRAIHDGFEHGLVAVAGLLRADRLHLRATDVGGVTVDEVLLGDAPLLDEAARFERGDVERTRSAIDPSTGTIRFTLTRTFELALGRGRAMIVLARGPVPGPFLFDERALLRRLVPHLATTWRAR